MANTIKFKKSLMTSAMSGLFGTTSPRFGNSTTNHGLYIYQGALPTQSEILGWTTLTTAINARSANLLFYVSYNSLFDKIDNGIATLKNSAYALASKTGTATYFILVSSAFPNNNSAFISGTVTNAAGDGDLKLTSTDMVQGQEYRVQSLNFTYPAEFTY